MVYENVVEDIKGLSQENLIAVSKFVQFLKSNDAGRYADKKEAVNKVAYLRTPGGFSGEVVMSEDFFETPDCFKEYV